MDEGHAPSSPVSSIDSDLARALDDDTDDPSQPDSVEPNGQQPREVGDDEFDEDLHAALIAADEYETEDDQQNYELPAQHSPADEHPSKRRKLESAQTPTGAVGAGKAAAPTGKQMPICPPHPIFVHGLCAVCGAPRPEDEVDDADPHRLMQSQQQRQQPQQRGSGLVTLKHLARHHIELGAGEAERIQKAAASRLLAARKLVLILDLDHTLLNSTRVQDNVIDKHRKQIAAAFEAEAQKGALSHQRQLFHTGMGTLYTKMRPGVYQLLEQLKDLFELHIYTMGDRSYANEIASLLDPSGRLFAGRIISANDSSATHQKGLDVVMASEALTLIVDDTEPVWRGCSANVIMVPRYHYWHTSPRQFGLSQQSLLEQGSDEPAAGGALARLTALLLRLHRAFYSSAEAVPLEQRDVRRLLAVERGKVLRGCQLVFTRCWPMSETQPEQQPLWRLATSLGATCSTSYAKGSTTHVVAAGANTAKAVQAAADGVPVVTPHWLQACKAEWRRVEEGGYSHEAAEQQRGERSRPVDEVAAAAAAAGGGGGAGAAAGAAG